MLEEALIPLAAVTWIGEGLKRPECVLTTAKGEVFAGRPPRRHRRGRQAEADIVGAPPGFLPNGVAMTRDREFLIANLGPGGGVWRLDRDWRLFPHLFEADGELLRVCNFVGVDAQGNEWISVSTRAYPRELSFRPRHADGFIVRRDANGAHIVADGIGFTNECRVDPTGALALRQRDVRQARFRAFPSKATSSARARPCTSSAPASSRTASRSTARAVCGSPASTPTASSASRPTGGAR